MGSFNIMSTFQKSFAMYVYTCTIIHCCNDILSEIKVQLYNQSNVCYSKDGEHDTTYFQYA